MANTVNVTSDILAQNALAGFNSIVAPLNTFSTNYSPAPAEKGATVSVPLYGTIANADNFAGNYTTNSDQTVNEVSVSLNTHFYKTIHVSDTDAAKGIDSAKLAFQAGVAVGTSVFTGAMAVLNRTRATNGTAAYTLNSASEFHFTGLGNLRTSAAAWPEKNAILDSTAYTALLLSFPNGTTLQDKATSNGTVPSAFGFGLYETNVTPMCQGNVSGVVMACNPAALAIASRYLAPDDGGAYKEARPIVDDKTKATLGYREFYDTAAGKKYCTFEWLGGYSAGVTGAVAWINES
ncbi:MAG: hypothetical protein Q7S40_03525 [Opitutaceae bacterium]|nr:hypothetical protein [Opitutaceae bacterium]